METVSDFILGAPKSLQMVTAAMKLKDIPWKESYDQPRQHIQMCIPGSKISFEYIAVTVKLIKM